MDTKISPPNRRRAVALQYNQGEQVAPKVVAKGAGGVAERIIALAEQHQVPIYHDPDLVEVLATLELDEFVPPELYRAVAEILAWVYSVNQDVNARKAD